LLSDITAETRALNALVVRNNA